MYAYLINDRVERLSDAPVEGWVEIDNGEEVMADTVWNSYDWRVEDGHAVLAPTAGSYQAKLADSDYTLVKIMEDVLADPENAQATLDKLAAKYQEEIAQRQQWRDAMRELTRDGDDQPPKYGDDRG